MEGSFPLWAYFVAGGVGDATAAMISHPMDVIKVRRQLRGELSAAKYVRVSLASTARSLITNEGIVSGLYRGLSASILRQSVFSTLRHGWYASLCAAVATRVVASQNGAVPAHPSSSVPLVAKVVLGCAAGAAAAAIANPSDVVLVRMQADGHWPAAHRRNYRHVFDGLARIVQKEGGGRLWRGCTPTVVRATLVTATQLPVYWVAKHTASGLLEDGPVLHAACASFSAAAAAIATNPVDVVKTRIMNMQQQQQQQQGATDRSTGTGTRTLVYRSSLDCARRTLATEGLRGFWKGLGATFARLLPHTVVMWCVQEQVLRAIAAGSWVESLE